MVFTITELSNPVAKKLLNVVLWERLDQLYQTLDAPVNDDETVLAVAV